MVKEDANRFLGAIAESPDLWRSINFRVVAIWANDAWQNLVATAHLDSRRPEDVPRTPDLPSLERLVGLQEIFPVETLPKLIRRLRLRGTVEVAGKPIRFLSDSRNEPFSQPYASSYHRRGLSIDDYLSSEFEYGHALMLTGDSASTLLRRFPGDYLGVDVALRRAGWQNLHELLLRGLGDTLRFDSTGGRRITFVAPLEVTLSKAACSLQEGQLDYAVLAGTKEVAARSVLTINGEDAHGRRIARSVTLRDKRWGRQKQRFRHIGRERLPKGSKVHVTLHVEGYEVGDAALSDEGRPRARPPLLMLAHDSLFPGERAFRSVLLEPQSSEGRLFERAVAKLFGYCGFPSDQPGKVPQEQNGPDVLAELPERNLLLVIETTVAHLINDEDKKMNRLTKRAANLRLALEPVNAEVVPVMVVPWPRATLVPVEVEEAALNGVRILCHEDLAHLLSMALAGTPVRQIAAFIVPEPPRASDHRYPRLAHRNPLASADENGETGHALRE